MAAGFSNFSSDFLGIFSALNIISESGLNVDVKILLL
jgi:hypothetical protein